MTNQMNLIHPIECKCFSWKPIIAGALIAIGFSFLLNLFSMAIGLTAFSTDSQGVENLALGGLLASALGIVVSMFAAGWITGYLGNRYCTKRHLGALYGFLAWCLALIVMVLIADFMAKYITFYTHFISGTVNNSAMMSPVISMRIVNQNHLVVSAYIVFCLFFLSAFACSLGGHCGMRYRCKETNF
ncbi:MAG: hypothetical protein JO149_08085 [Gammaproteobacteria bacterium]|nr:hypothetical protein [Gammaproteobacteria bacterium]